MKIYGILLSLGCLAVISVSQDCPKNCNCSDETISIASCTMLDSEMTFPERVKHLVIDSIPSSPVNLTKGFFKKIGLAQIQTLKITNYSVSYIDPGAFEGLQQLTDIDLSGNGPISIHPDTFQENGQLERLALFGNSFQPTQFLKAEENYFLKSSSLLELDLSNCQLSYIGKTLLSQVPNLQYINLMSNEIKVIDDYIFQNVPLLEEIDLSNNRIALLNGGIFEDIEELTALSLKNNLIENIDDLDLPGLKELDVSHNSLKMLKKSTFEGIPDLTSLNLSHNEIKWISEETFNDLIQLRYLDLSHNVLSGPVPKFIFEENEFLETLSLAGNKEMHLFEGFSTELPKLYQLDLSDCDLHNIANSSFNGMPNLAILNMSMNSLTALNHAIMSKLHRLNVLDLSYNNIIKIGSYTFTSNSHLRKLYLSNNRIHHLSPNTFETTPYISNLDISHNQFSHIWHVNESEYMKENKILNQLEYLNIAGNGIKDLHKHGFSHLTKLKAIGIFDNPLECTSEFPAFIEWLYTSHIQPLEHFGRSTQLEENIKKSNLQWDDLLMDVCKPQADGIEIKTKQSVKGEEVEMENVNFYQYTVIEDVKLAETTDNRNSKPNVVQKEKIDENSNTYVWPTFLIVSSIVFFTLAIGNTVALLIYRSRNKYNNTRFKTAFVTPFKCTTVKLDTNPRYHKLYEECSVPNNPIVKSNLLGNLINSPIKGAMIITAKNDNTV